MNVPIERITNRIYVIRGIKVMLDRDLAELYGVETRVLKQAVKRNINRFPADFMFELTKVENQALRSQNVTLKRGQHSKYLPYVFTEQGVAMLSSVLKSDRAIQVNIQIMRAFTQLRRLLSTHKDLKKKIEAMERKYDENFRIVFEAIKQLLEPDETPRKEIGFTIKEKQKAYVKSKPQLSNGLVLTPQARNIWESIPGNVQIKILNNVWCFNCRKTTGIGGDVSGKVAKGMLVLHGRCTRCGEAVARVIEKEK
jgi:phage regulator Rha-like protein